MAEKTRYSDEELQEFKEFALRGNVMDLAVGVIIGAAFQAIINSLVNDVISLRTLVLHSRYWKKEPLFFLKKRPAV